MSTYTVSPIKETNVIVQPQANVIVQPQANVIQTGMYMQVELISPELARYYLTLKLVNRKVSEYWINILAQDIIDGLFALNHQGIAFNTKINLIDGEQRLLAVIKANISVPMPVFRNVPEASIHTIDIGRKRDIVATMNFEQQTVSVLHISTLRSMFGFGTSRGGVSNSQLEILFRIHYDAITWTISAFGCSGMRSDWKKGTNNAPIRSVLARAYYSCDKTELEHFVSVLRSGFSTNQRDQPVIAFRNVAISNKMDALELYYKCERALHAFLNSYQLHKVFEAKNELFLLPGEILRTRKKQSPEK